MKDDKGLSASFANTIQQVDLTPLSDLAVEVSDGVLSDVLSSSTLKDIPVIGSLFALFKTAGSISDALFARKILRFLVGIADVPPPKRLEAVHQIEASQEQAREWGQTLLLLLDKMNHFKKPEILARAFRRYALGTMDLLTFWAVSHAVDLVRIDLLGQLRDYYRLQREMAPESALHFAMCGLVTLENSRVQLGEEPPTRFVGNTLGGVFVDLVEEVPG